MEDSASNNEFVKGETIPVIMTLVPNTEPGESDTQVILADSLTVVIDLTKFSSDTKIEVSKAENEGITISFHDKVLHSSRTYILPNHNSKASTIILEGLDRQGTSKEEVIDKNTKAKPSKLTPEQIQKAISDKLEKEFDHKASFQKTIDEALKETCLAPLNPTSLPGDKGPKQLA